MCVDVTIMSIITVMNTSKKRQNSILSEDQQDLLISCLIITFVFIIGLNYVLYEGHAFGILLTIDAIYSLTIWVSILLIKGKNKSEIMKRFILIAAPIEAAISLYLGWAVMRF